MCFGCSKEPSHLDGSFENPQHMFWLSNKKKYTLLYRSLMYLHLMQLGLSAVVLVPRPS